MFSSTLGWDIGRGAFEHFQQRLLDAFAGDIAGNRDVLVGLTNFVDFLLGSLYVIVGGLKQSQQEILNVLADVSGLCDSGGIAYCKRYL